MPQIDVIRPADPEETAGAFVAAMQRIDGPTFLALTRQVVPILNDVDVKLRREGVARGGYIAKNEAGKLDLIILSCGSELQHALAAAQELGDGARRLDAVLRAFQSAAGQLPRRSFAAHLPQTGRD
jgi:transketolase